MTSTIKVDNIAHSGGTTGLTINSSGRVSFPNRISFLAVGNNENYVTTSPVIPGDVRHNYGSGYNSSTGKFTVPSGEAGLYWFNAHFGIIYNTQAGGNGGSRIHVCNSSDTVLYQPYSYFNHAHSASYSSCPLTITYHLNEGDYVYLSFFFNNSKYYAGVSELSFQGMRIG